MHEEYRIFPKLCILGFQQYRARTSFEGVSSRGVGGEEEVDDAFMLACFSGRGAGDEEDKDAIRVQRKEFSLKNILIYNG